GWRSPEAFAGTPNNTRELAQTDKKKPQLLTVGGFSSGGGGGNRTRVRGCSIPGSTCLARRLISSRGHTTCEARRGTSPLHLTVTPQAEGFGDLVIMTLHP